ncbi:MAG: site-specific DNA-methyltransferase [Akkermansia sp.]|nr:site-specific DNA-methyltransferase [Akkermansia sp.]
MPYEKSSPSSPEAQSASPIQDNLKALAALFPSVVRDGQVDVDALRQLCGEAVVKEDELFGLNWRGKAEARRAALTPSLGTLRPCKEESKDWDTTQNLYIEGDNLEVLKLLRKSYGGKVKMIYIDPPYNTGKEFVYPDDYQNGIENYKKLTGQEGKFAANVESSGRFHTTWLNMMYPRLVLARDLLREDGVIFISIADHEICNLLSLCREIFGETNFVAQLIWQNKKGGGNDSKYIAVEHEYIVVFAKNKDRLENFYEKYSDEYLTRYNETDDSGAYFWDTFKRKSGKQYYSIVCPDGTKLENDEHGNPISWLRTETRFKQDLRDGEIRFVKNQRNEWSIQFKQRQPLGKKPRSIFTTETVLSDLGTTSVGAQDVFIHFNKDVFSNPKPVSLISFFLRFVLSEPNDIVMDFFSGSATTAEALLNLVSEGNSYRYILVQFPEDIDNILNHSSGEAKRIAENAISVLEDCRLSHTLTSLAEERIRRAGKKVKEEAGLAGQNLDIGFRVYKLDSSNVKAWNPQAEDLATAVNNYAEHLVGGRTEDDFLTEIMLKSGIDLVEEVQEREIAGHRVQSLGYGQYYACMAADLADDAEDVALGIAAWHEEDCAFAGGEQQDTCTVFVSDRAFASNDAAKMNFVAILEQHGICNIKAL